MIWRIFCTFGHNMTQINIYLASKPRYEILDGLRGVAAMLVVAYHIFEIHNHEGEEELTAFGKRLIGDGGPQFYTSHCTGDKVFAILKAVMGEELQPFCCGTTIKI